MGAVVMAGDGLVKPVNAPQGQATPIGVQPGTSGITFAHYVIVYGANGGVFLYNGQPGPGNPPVAWLTLASADPYGNAVSPELGVGQANITTVVFQGGGTIAGNAINGNVQIEPPAGSLINLSTFGQGYTVVGAMVTAGVFFLPPSGDRTGATDSAFAALALTAGWSLQFGQGTYYLDTPMAWANAQVNGRGDDTTIVPGTSWSGSALFQPGSNSEIFDLAGYGGSNTRSANPAAHFIQIQTGATFWRVSEIRCQFINGLIVSCNPATGSHGTIRNIRGEHCNGGVAINAGVGAAVTAEVNISDLDVQNCEVNEVLLLQAVTDVLCVGPVNGSVLAGVAANNVTVSGPCQTCLILGLDVGGGSGTGVLVFQSTAGGSPSEISVGPGTVQKGQAGVVVNAGARLYFHGLIAKGNQTDGWQWAQSGAFNVMDGCGGNTNNAGAAGGYDVNVTNASCGLVNDKFRYVSGGVTAGRFLPAGNQYTEANPPSTMTSAGAAPGGW